MTKEDSPIITIDNNHYPERPPSAYSVSPGIVRPTAVSSSYTPVVGDQGNGDVSSARLVPGTAEVITPAATTSLGNDESPDDSFDDSDDDDDDDDGGGEAASNRWLDVSSDRDDRAAADDAYFAEDGDDGSDVTAIHFASDVPIIPVKTPAHEIDAIEAAKRDLLRYDKKPYSTMYDDDDAEDPFESQEEPPASHSYQPSPPPETW